MNKVKLVQKIADIGKVANNKVTVFTSLERQKPWRDSEFEVFSKNKELDIGKILVFDEVKYDEYEKYVTEDKILVFIENIIKRIETIDNFIEKIIDANIDDTNFIEYKKDDSFNYEHFIESHFNESFNLGFNFITVFSTDESFIDKLSSFVLRVKSKDFYYKSNQMALKKRIEEKNSLIVEKNKDIEALESFNEQLKEKFESSRKDLKKLKKDKNKVIERMKKDKKDLEEKIKELKKEKEKIKEDKETLRKKKEKELKEVRKKMESERKKREEEKDKLRKTKEEEIDELNKRLKEERKKKERFELEKNRLIHEKENIKEDLDEFRSIISNKFKRIDEMVDND